MKKRIVIIENDSDFLKELIVFFSSTDNYEVVGSSADGTAGLRLISQLKPDLLILEIILSNGDGFSILEHLDCKQDMKIIVVSAINSGAVISKATVLGADYFMLKPISFSNLKMRIDDMLTPKTVIPILYSKNHIEEKITNIFISIGIPAHIIGFHFLREAVKIAMGNYKMVCSITKELYPKVANRFNTNSYKVERGIRHAIEVAWNKGRITNINSIFGLRVYDSNEKPSNGELIALLADKMLLDRFDPCCLLQPHV